MLEKSFNRNQLYEELFSSSSVLNRSLSKGQLSIYQEEVYRDPFTKEVEKTDFLQLTEEQDKALT